MSSDLATARSLSNASQLQLIHDNLLKAYPVNQAGELVIPRGDVAGIIEQAGMAGLQDGRNVTNALVYSSLGFRPPVSKVTPNYTNRYVVPKGKIFAFCYGQNGDPMANAGSAFTSKYSNAADTNLKAKHECPVGEMLIQRVGIAIRDFYPLETDPGLIAALFAKSVLRLSMDGSDNGPVIGLPQFFPAQTGLFGSAKGGDGLSYGLLQTGNGFGPIGMRELPVPIKWNADNAATDKKLQIIWEVTEDVQVDYFTTGDTGRAYSAAVFYILLEGIGSAPLQANQCC